jgi:hypothetical protein
VVVVGVVVAYQFHCFSLAARWGVFSFHLGAKRMKKRSRRAVRKKDRGGGRRTERQARQSAKHALSFGARTRSPEGPSRSAAEWAHSPGGSGETARGQAPPMMCSYVSNFRGIRGFANRAPAGSRLVVERRRSPIDNRRSEMSISFHYGTILTFSTERQF